MADRAQQLSQMVEKEVRYMLGDLQMQVIVLRQVLEMSGVQPPGDPQQQPAPQQQPPNPTRPGPSPDFPTPQHTPVPDPVPGEVPRQAANGRAREAIR
jgi:hypothetical protein